MQAIDERPTDIGKRDPTRKQLGFHNWKLARVESNGDDVVGSNNSHKTIQADWGTPAADELPVTSPSRRPNLVMPQEDLDADSQLSLDIAHAVERAFHELEPAATVFDEWAPVG